MDWNRDQTMPLKISGYWAGIGIATGLRIGSCLCRFETRAEAVKGMMRLPQEIPYGWHPHH